MPVHQQAQWLWLEGVHCCLMFKVCHQVVPSLTLTHWGRVTHICISKLTIVGSDNGLSPDRRQAIIWTNAGLLLIGPLGTNFSEILIEILTFSFKKMRLKVSSAKRRPFCLGLLVVNSSDGCSPGTHLTSNLWAHNSNLVKTLHDFMACKIYVRIIEWMYFVYESNRSAC